MQFTGHCLPVHQSMTVAQDFTLSHIVSQARLRQWNMQLPRLWNGMFGWVEGQYTTVGEFELKLRDYIYFRTNTLGKVMNLLIPLVMG